MATSAQAGPNRIALFPVRMSQSAEAGDPALDKALGEAGQKVRPEAKMLDAAGVLAITTRIGASGLEAVKACSDAACATELGGALGVDEVVLANAESSDEQLSLTLLRIDMRRGRILTQGHREGPRGVGAPDLVTELMQEVLGTARPANVEAEVHVVTTEAARSFAVRSRGDDPQPCDLTSATPCVLYLPASASTLQLSTEGYPARAMAITPKTGVSTYSVRTAGHSGLFTASIFGSLVGAGMMIGGSVDLARGIEPAVPAVSLSVGTVLLAAAVFGIYSMYPSLETVEE